MNYLQAAKDLSLLFSRFSKTMDRHLSAHGITLTEYMLLDALHTSPEHTMRRIDLAEAIGLTASGVTRIVNPLEKIHILSKASTEHDARVSLVKLTDAGKERYNDASTTVKNTMKQFMEKRDESEFRALQKIVKSF